MKLVLVESPTKARTLTKFFLGGDYRVEATMGHLRDLPKNKMGFWLNPKMVKQNFCLNMKWQRKKIQGCRFSGGSPRSGRNYFGNRSRQGRRSNRLACCDSAWQQ